MTKPDAIGEANAKICTRCKQDTPLGGFRRRRREVGAVRLPRWTEFRVPIDPDGSYVIDPEALAVNRYEERRAGGEWAGAVGEHEAMVRLRAFADGAAAAFYGAAFDAPFLDAAERRRGLAPRREWGRRALDVPSMMWALDDGGELLRDARDRLAPQATLGGVLSVRRWVGGGIDLPSLDQAIELLGVEAPRPGERHTALGDARAAARVAWALTFGWGKQP